MNEEQIKALIQEAILQERERLVNKLRNLYGKYTYDYGDGSNLDFEGTMAELAKMIETET